MSSKHYNERMLNYLLDRYENSVLYTGQNQVNVTIAAAINRQNFPEYFVEGSLTYDEIHEQLLALERAGLIRLKWKNEKTGHILEKCILCTDRAEDAYRLLNRRPRREKEAQLLAACEHFQGKNDVLDAFLKWIRSRILHHESIAKYVDLGDIGRIERICTLIWHIVENQEDIFLREFSIRWFRDSKVAEKDIHMAAEIIREFAPGQPFDQLDWTDILEEYNIYRNPSWIMMKGYGYFQIEENNHNSDNSHIAIIPLEVLRDGIGISNQDAPLVRWNHKCAPMRILTVENLTSFHQWKMDDKIEKEESKTQKTLCIYLGGYHNHVKRAFLKNLYQSYPEAEYVHFGDIDCGGFRIWKDLCEKTGIPFRTYAMGVDTYQKYQKYGKELTALDRKTLEKMLEDPFFEQDCELFRLMLESGYKIEQELIRCN